MKYLMMLLIVLNFSSCSTGEKKSWDGAQRQEATLEEAQNEQQDQLRNQFPGHMNF